MHRYWQLTGAHGLPVRSCLAKALIYGECLGIYPSAGDWTKVRKQTLERLRGLAEKRPNFPPQSL